VPKVVQFRRPAHEEIRNTDFQRADFFSSVNGNESLIIVRHGIIPAIRSNPEINVFKLGDTGASRFKCGEIPFAHSSLSAPLQFNGLRPRAFANCSHAFLRVVP
jgi:hypothetical protein